MAARIVLIDDEIRLLRALKRALETDGHEVFDFSNPQDALQFIRTRPPNLVVSDIRMPGLSGLDLLEIIAREIPDLPCLLMTAYSSMETAVTAMRLGARDYLLKPFEVGDFKAAIRRVLEMTPGAGNGEGKLPLVIGASRVMHDVADLVERVAETESTVLLQGESGTGKELLARTLHLRSRRSQQGFIAVNCSTLPEALFESEMFGHVRGSFSGAVADKSGLFAEAEGGTLFLDEIGDLAVANQAKLLRVLQDGTFKRVGDVRQQQSNVRVLAASNRDLVADVKAGRFREDLLYRINVVEIRLPPLRERMEDLPALVGHFLSRFSVKHRRPLLEAGPDVLAHLRRYRWPGNIRQLENILERAVILQRSGPLSPADLPLPAEDPLVTGPSELHLDVPLDEAIERIELETIIRVLRTVNWNFSRGAERMGITRQNLHYKIKKYGIRRDDDGPPKGPHT